MRSTASQVVIQDLSITALRDLGGALLRAHYEEIARNKDVMVLDPDWERYETLEKQGHLLSIGAFDGGKLLGYSVNFVVPHHHYKGLIYCQNDVLFVAMEARRSRLGLDLIAETEKRASARGAQLVCWHAKKDSVLDRLLDRQGYGVQDIIYSRRI